MTDLENQYRYRLALDLELHELLGSELARLLERTPHHLNTLRCSHEAFTLSLSCLLRRSPSRPVLW